jgi:cytolysin-activating lysine-acyltransferase
MTISPQGAPANGVAQRTASKSRQEIRQAEVQSRMAQNFSQIVAVLMRDKNFKNLRIADLEWLVLPAILAGQFRLAHARSQSGTKKKEGVRTGFAPVAVALWARVSLEVDKLLSSEKPAQLQPSQWTSGDIHWLLVAAGDERAIPTFLKQFAKNELRGKEMKLRAPRPDGTFVVKTVGEYLAKDDTAAASRR